MAQNKENTLLRYITDKNREIKVGGTKLNILGKEVSIHKATQVLTRDINYTFIPEDKREIGEDEYKENIKGSFGRIDLLCSYKGKKYCCELKYENTPNQFFGALKTLGYTAYYNWENNTKYLPAIMMPSEQFTFEHQIMAGRLDIAVFLFKEDGKEFKFKLLDDKPVWHQKNW